MDLSPEMCTDDTHEKGVKITTCKGDAIQSTMNFPLSCWNNFPLKKDDDEGAKIGDIWKCGCFSQ